MIYTVYYNVKDGALSGEVDKATGGADIILIKEGFSVGALVFSSLWFIYHRMWKMAIGVFIVNNAIKYCLTMAGFNYAPMAALLMINLFCGLFANEFRERHLIKRGYALYSAVVAENPLQARVKLYADMDRSPLAS